MNEQVELLESQLSEMPSFKRLGIYAVILIALVFMSWNIFGEEMYNEIESKHESIASLERKLQKNSTRSLQNAIKKARKESLALEDDLTNLHFKDQFLRTKLESVNFILYDQKGSAQILDDILKQSLTQGITIDLIESLLVNMPYHDHLIEKTQINVKGDGSFKSIMGLLQYIDSLNVLMRTKMLTITINENNDTYFDLNISHYGAEL
jgi:Tfp pilus assembly protein PilO